MTSPSKILVIDDAPDRKERINMLKNHGYSVFPALKLDEARSRCVGGNYDLVVVNAGEDGDRARAFCDGIQKQCPKQLLLMRTSQSVDREYAVGLDSNTLLERVNSLLPNASSTDLASAA
jgi:DNA-binding response OmpR family regulator